MTTATHPSGDRAPEIADQAVSAGDVLVPLAAGVGGEARPAPAWIKIAPRGPVTDRNGVPHRFDPEALAARFASDATSVPIDLDHSTVHLASKGKRSDAVGWIEEMEARGDGLYGRVEWLEAGKAALAGKTHRYLSPSFPKSQTGDAIWIHSVALTTAPALSRMPALAHAATSENPTADPSMTQFATLAATLGLPADASEATMLSAVQKIQNGDKVDKAVHDQALTNLAATTQQLKTLQANQRKAEVDAVLDQALKDKRIVPAQRGAYEALCATDDGLTQVKTLLSATAPSLAASGLDGNRPPVGGAGASSEVTPETLAAKANAYQAEQAQAGNPITYLAAFNHVEAELDKEAGQ